MTTRIILSQNFKLVVITFAVVLLMNQTFKNMFVGTFCSYLQECVQQNLRYSKSNFRLKYFLC